MTKLCFALIIILAGCFHVTTARRELKSILPTDSAIYSTLSSEDQPPPRFRRSSSLGRFPRRRALQAANTTSGRIAYGQEASDVQFPFVVYFDVNGDKFCSGSIIAPRVILTAAHCVKTEAGDFEDTTKSHIYFGSTEYDDTYDAGEISSFIIPNSYLPDSASRWFGDIALIKLAKPIPSSYKPIALANAATKVPGGTTLTVAGWGAMDNGELAHHLMYTTGPVLSFSDCNAASNDEFGSDVEVDHFCIAVPQDTMQKTCHGDSGGPHFIVQNGKPPVQVGITSYGTDRECGSSDSITVPTSIQYWRNWIDNTMSMYNLKGTRAPVKLNVPAEGRCFGGTVLSTKMIAEFGKCLEMCRANAACKAWTWKKGGSCTLLTAKGGVTKSADCTSGYFN